MRSCDRVTPATWNSHDKVTVGHPPPWTIPGEALPQTCKSLFTPTGQFPTQSSREEAHSRGLPESRAPAVRSEHTFSTTQLGPHRAPHSLSGSPFKPHPVSTFEAIVPINIRPQKGSVSAPWSFAWTSKDKDEHEQPRIKSSTCCRFLLASQVL